MTDKIKSAFDLIRAEDSLKETTLQHLHERVQDNQKPRRYFAVKRLAAIAACFVVVLSSCIFAYSLYFTAAAYVDLDINPSLALTINTFDRVIGVEAYNDNAGALLADMKLQYKKMDVAMDEIIAAAAETGVLQQERLVSVTVQSISGDDEALLSNVQRNVTASVAHHMAAEVDVFSVDSNTRSAAYKHHISPAKYLAILELQEVDPTTSISECSSHSIGEIQQLITEHGSEHHGEGSNKTNSSETETGIDADTKTDTEANLDDFEKPENGHHVNGHHGNGHE